MTDRELQHCKLANKFVTPGTEYQNVLYEASFAASYDYIQSAPILGFSVHHPSAALSRPKRRPHVLELTRTLDAPNLIDDSRIDILSWGPLLYAGLDCKLYSYAPLNGKVKLIESASTANSMIHSIAFNKRWLVRGGSDNTLTLFDINTYKEIQHFANLGLSFQQIKAHDENGFFAVSNQSGSLEHFDFRTSIRHCFFNHEDPNLLGLAYNSSSLELAVSSESRLRLFDIRNFNEPVWAVNHDKAFRKTIAFSPDNPKRLVTGGGVDNPIIQMWDTSSGQKLAYKVTGSPVYGVHWIDERTLVSHHGSREVPGSKQLENSIACWNVKDNLIELNVKSDRQAMRIFCSAQNPKNKSEFAMGLADETLRFWFVKRNKPNKKPEEQPSVLTMPVLR